MTLERIEELARRQIVIEERISQSETRLATSIDSLSAVVNKLNEKLEAFVQLHQAFVVKILLILAGIFLGKEIIIGIVEKWLK